MEVLGAIAAVLAVTFLVPLAVYGAASALTELRAPAALPLPQFVATVVLEKAGVAVAFVGVMAVAGKPLRDAWAGYAALWWFMFVVSEVVEVLRRNQDVAELAAGAISEAVYFPLAGLIAARILA